MASGQRIWIFAIAALAPAAILGFLAVQSVRTEESIRRAESEDQARAFLKVAAREIQADLDARLTDLKASAAPVPPPAPDPAEPPDLAESVRRERPDLIPLLLRANALEFSEGQPSTARALLMELAESIETPSTRARLIAAAARCARKGGAQADAVKLYERLIAESPDVRGESMLPLGALARVQLLTLGGDRERLLGELRSLALDPASEIVLLGRLESAGIPAGDRLHRARVLRLAQAHDLREGDVRWYRAGGVLWVVFVREGVLRAERVDPSDGVMARLRETARVGGLSFEVGDSAPGLQSEVAGGALKIGAVASDSAGMRSLTSSRRFILAGVVLLLLAVMAGGLVASLRAAQREMRLARLKSDFISGVSHELRTPLTSIRIFSDLLSTPGPAEKREEHAALLKREAERLSGLVERVLDFSRLEKGGSYRLEEQDLAAVVDQAVRTFRSPKPGFDVKVTTEPLVARVDALGVEQIVHNLLDNAAKYAGPATEVVLRRDGARALLEVKDRGPGIDPEDLPHVFETFYRGSSETPGTGLGLAIVRQIAEAHGGSVRVASAPSSGATFTVEIPLCRASSS